jgi:LmbE family N-acetylglucosaminyl deacetylase
MRVAFACAVAVLLTSCGDNIFVEGNELPVVDRVNIVAHPDDDLLFMQPDLWTSVTRGDGILTVYVTAGQAKKDINYADQRQVAILFAYQAASHATAWTCGALSIADRLAEHCSAIGTKGPVSVVFLGIPDGGPLGTFPGSLLSMWQGTSETVKTIARRPQKYSQADVVSVLAEILRRTRPKQIYTLDVVATHGQDHSDHMLVGAATSLAVAEIKTSAPIVSFRGYNSAGEPENKIPSMYDAVSIMMRGYGACTDKCGSCGSRVCSSISDFHDSLLRRRYATSLHQRKQRGQLQFGAACLSNTGGSLALRDCSTAPVWNLANDQLALADKCVTVSQTGAVNLAPCEIEPAPSQWWRLHDDGFVVGGLPPPRVDDMLQQHTLCLLADASTIGATVHGMACGGNVIPTWQLLPQWNNYARVSSRPAAVADIDGDGRADLCELRSEGVFCGLGNGSGLFAEPQRADAEPLTPTADTLVVGHDRLGAVACTTRDRTIVCMALRGSSRAAWSKTVDAAIAVNSLTLVDINHDGALDLCVSGSALQCFDHTGSPLLLSNDSAGMQLVDVDSDGVVDRCGFNNGQLQCSIAADVPWRDIAVPWSYSHNTVFDFSTAALSVWGDLDGDNRVDACFATAADIRCAYGSAYGTGPAVAVPLPSQHGAITQLWLADIDGDGGSEVCFADATQLSCIKP